MTTCSQEYFRWIFAQAEFHSFGTYLVPPIFLARDNLYTIHPSHYLYPYQIKMIPKTLTNPEPFLFPVTHIRSKVYSSHVVRLLRPRPPGTYKTPGFARILATLYSLLTRIVRRSSQCVLRRNFRKGTYPKSEHPRGSQTHIAVVVVHFASDELRGPITHLRDVSTHVRNVQPKLRILDLCIKMWNVLYLLGRSMGYVWVMRV